MSLQHRTDRRMPFVILVASLPNVSAWLGRLAFPIAFNAASLPFFFGRPVIPDSVTGQHIGLHSCYIGVRSKVHRK